jgi:thioredoxin 1
MDMSTKEITIDNIAQTIESGDIVLLDFWAAWCGPCRAFGPVFEKASAEHDDIVFGKVDTEAQQELAAGFRITSIPTLMAFREGVLVFSQPGALAAPQLEQVITAVKGLDMTEVRAQVASSQADGAAQR